MDTVGASLLWFGTPTMLLIGKDRQQAGSYKKRKIRRDAH